MREYESGSPIFMPSVSHACRKNIPELRSQKRYSNQHFITWFGESSEVEDIEENERMRMRWCEMQWNNLERHSQCLRKDTDPTVRLVRGCDTD